MKNLKILKKTLLNMFLFIIVYLAIYGSVWLFFVKQISKITELESAYTINNLLELSNLAFESAKKFTLYFSVIYLVVTNFKYLKKMALSFKNEKKIIENA